MAQANHISVGIIGAGLVGLTLAQALQERGISVRVYERDDAPETEKGGGWAITIHWALAALERCLPGELFQQLDSIQVDPEQAIRDTGRFLFLNMQTREPKYVIPPSKRMRVNRKMLKNLLAQGIDIIYGKGLATFEAANPLNNGDVTIRFIDGSTADHSVIIACDGSNSKARHLLFSDKPAQAALYHIPVRAMGVTIRMSPEEAAPLRQVDPLLFQGCHPDTGVFFWYSTVTTPALNGSVDSLKPYYEGQLILSWKYDGPEDEIKDTNDDRLAQMRKLVAGFHSTFSNAVHFLTSDTKVKPVRLADWPTRRWPNHSGRTTLAGDAAHAMTMYRGEAFNHGVTDAANLVGQLKMWHEGKLTLTEAIEAYEEEVCKRTHEAVLLSRQACLDAHDFHALQENSPLVSKRARILSPAIAASNG